MCTDAASANNWFVKTGAAQCKQSTGKSIEDSEGHIWYDDYLYMNGGAIINFTLDAVPDMMKQLLEKSCLEKENIDYYVFHQANQFMLSAIRKVCSLPKEKYYMDMANVGNTVSSTIFIGLKECIKNNTIQPGMKVMCCGFGVGLSWGGTVLKF